MCGATNGAVRKKTSPNRGKRQNVAISKSRSYPNFSLQILPISKNLKISKSRSYPKFFLLIL